MQITTEIVNILPSPLPNAFVNISVNGAALFANSSLLIAPILAILIAKYIIAAISNP